MHALVILILAIAYTVHSFPKAAIDPTPDDARITFTSRPNYKYFVFKTVWFIDAPDGYETVVYGVNYTMQYPIVVNRGDDVMIRVENYLGVPTSIHFQGLSQTKKSNPYDGAAGITQCPIPDGKHFVYRFPHVDRHGTYWWHAEYGGQTIKGLNGPLIIRDPDHEPYTKFYDDEYVVVLSDWFHAYSPDELRVPFMNSSDGIEPLPDSGLINGKGRYDCSKVDHVDWCNPNAPLEVFKFVKGKRYRLRIINAAVQAIFSFSIDQHELHVIEADGVDTQVSTVDVIRVAPGQRYSVIVSANGNGKKNYWMRAVMDPMAYTQYTPGVFDPHVFAIVSYTGTDTDPGTDSVPKPRILDPFKLLPYRQTLIPDTDITRDMSFTIKHNNHRKSRAFVTVSDLFRHSAFKSSMGYPVLLRVARNEELTSKPVNPMYAPLNQIIDLVIYNDDPIEHPFTLHGYRLQVMDSGVVSTVYRHGRTPKMVRHRPERDTVAVPSCRVRRWPHAPYTPTEPAIRKRLCGNTRGFVHVRVMVDNPGVWLLRSQIEWRRMQGLALTVIVDEDSLRQPSRHMDTIRNCQLYNQLAY